MKLAVIGSRGYPDIAQVSEFVLGLPRDVMIITGGARGVDHFAELAAQKRRISRLIYEPTVEDRDPRYVAALHARNERIVRAADRVVAFWDGESPGTRSVIELAERLGKSCEVRRAR